MSSLDCDSGLLPEFYCTKVRAVHNSTVGLGDHILELVNWKKVLIMSNFSSNRD